MTNVDMTRGNIEAGAAAAMAVMIRMAAPCAKLHSASGLSLSSSSSKLQAGCSSSQELAYAAQRLCSSSSKPSLGNAGRRHSGIIVQIRAGKGPPKQGRGYNAKKAAADGIRQRMQGRDLDLDGWIQVLTEEELPEGKNKAIIHKNLGYMLVKNNTALYAIEANCTSCKFPMIEGKVTDVKEEATAADKEAGLRIECPLCHTKFSLEDGKVVEYCPKDGPVAWAIGIMKEKAPPVAAKVYPARISNAGRVYVRFAIGGTAV